MVKKIILAAFFAVLICVFVGFNYLLVQKENADEGTAELEKSITAKDATILNQLDRISELETESADLAGRIEVLEGEDTRKAEAIAALETTAAEREGILLRREDLISKFKQSLDVELVGQQAREWLEFVNSREYEKAYARFGKAIDNSYTTMVLSEFRTYYEQRVGMMQLKSLDVMTRGIPEWVDNDLVIVAVVDLVTPAYLERFNELMEERRVAAEAERIAAAEAAGQTGDARKDETAGGAQGDEATVGGDGDLDGAEGSGAADPDSGGAANPADGDGATGETGAAGAGEGDLSAEHVPPDVTLPAAGVGVSVAGSGADADAPDGQGAPEQSDAPTDPDGLIEPDMPEEEPNYDTASAVLEVIRESIDEFPDDLEESIFKTGENQFFFLMNYKKEANDWEIVRIVQKL